MAELFNLVLITSFYASIVGICIIVIKQILKNRINAFWHYFIWIVLLLKLIIPFGPESAVSLFNAMTVDLAQTDAMGIVSQIGQENIIAGGSIATIENPLPEAPETTMNVEGLAPYIWVLGVGLMFAWLLFTNYTLHYKLRKNTPASNQRLESIFEVCKKKIRINKNIELILQDTIGTPSLFGVIRPKILLAPNVLNLSDKEVEYILLHELAHYKRKDVVVNYLLLVFQVIHWFNPVIWYCFKRIRQDMEAATDEKVLGFLEKTEHKEYGKALLAVLDSFNSPRIAPKLLGMVDDRKNIERRIKMIKMAELFKGKRLVMVVIGFLCIFTLSGLLLTSGLTKEDIEPRPTAYNVDVLLKNKTAYVGDNSKVVTLINSLPYANVRGEVSLQTRKTPYEIQVIYDFSNVYIDPKEMKTTFQNNATLLFSLIKNVDIINFNLKGTGEEIKYQFNRGDLQKSFNKDLREYGKDSLAFETLLNSLELRMLVYPQKYIQTMSSTPGIRVLAQYSGVVDKVRYSTDYGSLLTWDPSSGIIREYGKKVELPYNIPVYWTPSKEGSPKGIEKSTVQVGIVNKKGTLAEKQVIIGFDAAMYVYLVEAAADIIIATNAQQNPKTIEEAVSRAIKAQSNRDSLGEFSSEGHVILDVVEKDGIVTVYTISSYGAFGFENDIFTFVSGTSAVPSVITFHKNQEGEYLLVEYKEPQDGSRYITSIKEMFPKKLWNKVLNIKENSDISKQQEAQAVEYLKSIGRIARVSSDHVEKKLADINVSASNTLFAEYTKENPELNNFPFWLGTREQIENGVRYIYETSQNKTNDGFDLMIFTKKKEDGTIVKEFRYKIVGSEPQLLK